MSAWTAGTQLGPYELTSPIGKGGMGEVWKARDTRLNRTVAIKRLTEKHSARFEQEARAIAALNHPHICTLYDIGPDYLVMEYVEGSVLQGPVPAEEALRCALQMARALEAAHAKGILHRDLKPGNIMMTGEGAKLLDFGLAKILNPEAHDATQTMDGFIAGTTAYMSPEQARGEPLDARSDMFSFGAVLYELLDGNQAFTGVSATDVLSAVIRSEPPPLNAPADLAAIVHRCLQKSRDRRFDSMTDLRRALEQVKLDAGSQPSIAVLPFANMSRDADDEYFSDGLAEEVINALVKVPGLKVIARTSAFAFKGQNTDIRKIAGTLGVTTVLEGSVRRAGSRIRVTAQLITAADGSHLWSERYDRELTDVFAIQDEIAAAITAALQLKLGAAPAPRHTPNMAAYEAYLKYRYYQWNFTPEAAQRSKECLEQALVVDPKFALPYVGLADYHLALASAGGLTAEESMPRARELAQRALELDPDLPEAHAMLGIVAGHYDFDWKECERRFRLAIAREPVSVHLRQWYALFYLLSVGRLEESRVQHEQVIETDPLCQMWYFVLTQIYQAGAWDAEALAAIQKSVDLDPQFWFGWARLGTLHALHGRAAEALECVERAYAIAPWSPYSIGPLAGLRASAGNATVAQEMLDKLHGKWGYSVALCYYRLVCGDAAGAVDALSQVAEQRFPAIIVTTVRPLAPLMRQAPGWPALLKKMNLTEAS